MGEYHLEDLALRRSDKENILHPRYYRSGIPPAGTFQSIVRDRVVNRSDIIDRWCNEQAWFEHSPTWDFWVIDEAKYRWGLPVLVPTCPRKLFMQGPRLKYVDIVTDTQHASSSDLITWNTLVMMKLRWLDDIPRKWVDITVNSLEAWNARTSRRMVWVYMMTMRHVTSSVVTFGPLGLPWLRNLCRLMQHCKRC